jgi:hypothetical protein
LNISSSRGEEEIDRQTDRKGEREREYKKEELLLV